MKLFSLQCVLPLVSLINLLFVFYSHFFLILTLKEKSFDRAEIVLKHLEPASKASVSCQWVNVYSGNKFHI